jgi:hypothetical protein
VAAAGLIELCTKKNTVNWTGGHNCAGEHRIGNSRQESAAPDLKLFLRDLNGTGDRHILFFLFSCSSILSWFVRLL